MAASQTEGHRGSGSGDYPSPGWDGFHSGEANRNTIDELLHHAAVKNHGSGISSPELADFVDLMCILAQERIVGVGADQYDTGRGQKFEQLSEEQLRRELIEELIDVINYAAMLAVKVAAR